MKKVLYIIIAFLSIQLISAQEKVNVSKDSIYNFSIVDKSPVYPGGLDLFYKFISDNFNPPKTIDFKGGKLIASVTINVDGSISDIKILREIGFGTDEELKRVLSICDKWIPGEINGIKVGVNFVFPITILAPKLDVEDTNLIYNFSKVDVKPNFPNGMEQFYKFIAKNYNVPNVINLSGKVFVSFVIDVDGSVVDIKVIRDVGYGTGKEAIRVLKMSTKWIPGAINGIPVRVLYSLPINIESSGNINNQNYDSNKHNSLFTPKYLSPDGRTNINR